MVLPSVAGVRDSCPTETSCNAAGHTPRKKGCRTCCNLELTRAHTMFRIPTSYFVFPNNQA